MITKQEIVIKDKVRDIVKYLINNFGPVGHVSLDKHIYVRCRSMGWVLEK